MDPNPPPDRALEAAKLEHASNLEVWKAVLESGQTALRSLILINGGAVVALLAFLGNQLTKTPPTGRGFPTQGIALAMAFFVGGVLFAGAATGARYLNLLSLHSRRTKPAIVYHRLAILLGSASLVAFLVGGVASYLAFLK